MSSARFECRGCGAWAVRYDLADSRKRFTDGPHTHAREPAFKCRARMVRQLFCATCGTFAPMLAP